MVEPFLGVFNHLIGVLAEPHDHDASGDLAGPVGFGQTPPQFGAEVDLGHVPEQDGDALGSRAQGDVSQVLDDLFAGLWRTEPPAQVSQPADHVLAFGDLHDTAADVDIRPFDRPANLADGQVVGEQAIGIDLDLILFHIAADGRDFGDPVDGHQVVTEIPVLKRTEVGQVLFRANQRLVRQRANARITEDAHVLQRVSYRLGRLFA